MVYPIVLEIDGVSVFEATSSFRISKIPLTIARGAPDRPFIGARHSIFLIARAKVIPGDYTLVATITSATEPSATAMVVLKENLVSVIDVGGGSESHQAYEKKGKKVDHFRLIESLKIIQSRHKHNYRFTSAWFVRGDNV